MEVGRRIAMFARPDSGRRAHAAAAEPTNWLPRSSCTPGQQVIEAALAGACDDALGSAAGADVGESPI